MNDLQALLDGLSARLQRERAKTQMTLGKLIETLEAMPEGAQVANLRNPHSYRGYYEDLALEPSEGLRPAEELLAECRAAMGKAFHGYKGGRYIMGEDTPVWVSGYGDVSGLRLMAVIPSGGIETEEEV